MSETKPKYKTEELYKFRCTSGEPCDPRPFQVFESELEDAGGWIACDRCGKACEQVPEQALTIPTVDDGEAEYRRLIIRGRFPTAKVEVDRIHLLGRTTPAVIVSNINSEAQRSEILALAYGFRGL